MPTPNHAAASASIAGVGLLLLSACASVPREKTGAEAIPSPPGKDDCLFVRTLNDWSVVDRERLIIYGIGNVPYLATLSFPSHQLPFEFAIGFLDHDRDGRLCGHGFDSILVRDGAPDRISIRSLQRIEKEDAKQLLQSVNQLKRRRGKLQPATAEETASAPDGGQVAPVKP